MSMVADTEELEAHDYVDHEGPDVEWLSKKWHSTIDDLGPFIDQCRNNYETRFALWDSQTSDGKKAGVNPFPWKGASDLRVYLVDEIINAQKALLVQAFSRSNLVAVPVEANDIARAKVVSGFMRWLVMTQIPHMEREVALLADYMLEKGIAATGQFWERKIQKTLEVLNLEEIAQSVPELAEALADPANDQMMIELIRQAYPSASKRKARSMLKELREKGETTIATPGQVINRPVIRAFSLDDDLYIPSETTDIEHAPVIYRKQYFTPEHLREKIVTDNWDEDWVEHVIKTQRGKRDEREDENFRLISRGLNSPNVGEVADADLVLVVYAYQRLGDVDNVPGIYETVFNPYVKAEDGTTSLYGKFGLLPYKCGEYPFVIFRREYLGRRLHDTRGVPEIGKPYQDQVKVQRDSRVDNTSMATLPPIEYPIGRPPTSWGPGARVPVRRSGEYGYVERPPFPDASVEVEQTLLKSLNQYFARPTDESDMAEARAKQQQMVAAWLQCWSRALQQVWSLFQQYGDDEVYYRVIGAVKSEPVKFEKGNPDEKYDFYISYDVLQSDPEQMLNRLKALVEFAQMIDRNGQIDYSELLQAVVEAIDPILGERVIQPKEAASMREVNEEQTELAKLFAGMENNIPLGAANELRLQVIEQYTQNPAVQQRLAQDENFRKGLEKRIKQFQHQIQQGQNALIGRYGA